MTTKDGNDLVRMISMICNPDKDYIWRVVCFPTGEVVCNYIGYIPIDTDRRAEYSTFDKLPEWIKNALAVLIMLPPHPSESVLFGVGRRIDEVTYWVVQPYELVGVDDPRGEDQKESSHPA